MTAPADLDTLDAMLKEATPAPWHFVHKAPRETVVLHAYTLQDGTTDHDVVARLGDSVPDEYDAALICALRNAAPSMIAERDALRAEVAEMRRTHVRVDPRLVEAVRLADECKPPMPIGCMQSTRLALADAVLEAMREKEGGDE